MASFQLHSRRARLFAVAFGVGASACVLGGTLMLFAASGSTPVFEPGSLFARQAVACRQSASVSVRHQCLRDLATVASNMPSRSALLAKRMPAGDPNMP